MIDDLCDSGLTLMSVRDKLLEAGAASVRSVVLLDKRARRKVREQSLRFRCSRAQEGTWPGTGVVSSGQTSGVLG